MANKVIQMYDGNDKIFPSVALEGWKVLPLDSAFEAYSENSTPYYRKSGNIVEACGIVKPKSAIAAGGATVIGTLPVGYRPGKTLYQLCQGSGKASWLLTIYINGTLNLSRYGTTADSEVIAGAWLPFHITFTTG